MPYRAYTDALPVIFIWSMFSISFHYLRTKSVNLRRPLKISLYENIISGSKYTDSKEFLVIPGAVHTDLYDGGSNNAIPFDKVQEFFEKYL